MGPGWKSIWNVLEVTQFSSVMSKVTTGRAYKLIRDGVPGGGEAAGVLEFAKESCKESCRVAFSAESDRRVLIWTGASSREIKRRSATATHIPVCLNEQPSEVAPRPFLPRDFPRFTRRHPAWRAASSLKVRGFQSED